MTQPKTKLISALTGIMTLFFFQSAQADLGSSVKLTESLATQSTGMDAIGDGSKGSYAHGEKKSEGSKSKVHPPAHRKSEGSGSKSYSGHHGSKSGDNGHASSSEHKKHHYAKSSHGSHDRGHASKCFFSHLLNFRHKLQLSDAQVEEIQKMRFEYKKTTVMLGAEKEVAKMDFDGLVHGKTVDEAAIRAAGDKIIAIKTKKIKAKVEAKIALMKLLTDEQRNQVHKMHSSH